MKDSNNMVSIGGCISIKDQQVHITDSQNSTEKAIIVPGKNVTIIIDNAKINIDTPVTSKNKIQIIPDRVEPIRELELTIAPDKMTATLYVNYKPGKCFFIDDVSDTTKLVVNALRSETIEKQFTPEEVINYLQSKKITYGIDRNMVEEAIATGRECIIARGKPLELGKDGWIENLIDFDENVCVPEEGHGIIGERLIKAISSNQKLAKVHPPREGKPGFNVYNQEVLPPTPKTAKITPGPGTTYDPTLMLLISTTEGRLDIKGTMYSVLPIFTLQGNADPKDGYVKFNGDVVVKGNVMDGMKIEAKGNLEVFGFAANSTLTAGGEIIVHNNLLGCLVQAGGHNLLYEKSQEAVQSMAKNLCKFINTAQALKEELLEQGQAIIDGNILKILLEQKFRELPSQIEQTSKELAKLEKLLTTEGVDISKLIEIAENINKIRIKLRGLNPLQIKNLDKFADFINKAMADAMNYNNELTSYQNREINIICPYIQNCDIQTTGNVLVKGKGCYNTKIYASGDVNISGSPGVFRGGSITAKGWVKVQEIGSSAEIPTFIQVDKDSFIKSSIVHPGTILKCGPRIEKIIEEQTALYFNS